VLAANARKRPIDHFSESKSDDDSHHTGLWNSTACSGGPLNTRILAQNSACSRTAIFHRNRNYKDSRDATISMRRRNVGLLFQSMRVASDEPLGTYMGILGAESSLYIQSSSKRTTTLASVLAVVGSFGRLSFARREGSSNSNNHIAEPLKTFLWRLMTSLQWTTWYLTITLAFAVSPIL